MRSASEAAPLNRAAGNAPRAGRAGSSPATSGARVAVFVAAACVLVTAFAALVRSHGFHSPLGIAALLALELAAIALAVGFHLTELPAVSHTAGRRRQLPIDVDYL